MSKRMCQTQKTIVRAIRGKVEDPVVSNKALFHLHQEMYHRRVKEYDKDCEVCKVWNETVDIWTWEELRDFAATTEKTE